MSDERQDSIRQHTRVTWLLALALAAVPAAPAAVHAQARPAPAPQPAFHVTLPAAAAARPSLPQAVEPPGTTTAFAVELAGGVLGSAVGFGAIVLVSERGQCGDNLACVLGNVAAAITLATVGASAGTYLAGSAAGTRPSLAGTVIGAVVGAAAAVGVNHLVTEEMSVGLSRAGHVALFAVTQGTLTAAGSRLGAALR